jgi:hypothetical protein
MEVLVEMPNKKVGFGNKSIKKNPLEKIKKPISPEKKMLIYEFKEAIAELNLVRAGKLQGKKSRELLNEL